MKKRYNIAEFFKANRLVYILFVFLGLYGCTEPFIADDLFTEDLLVVNATISDQVRKQEVILSRTIGFEADTPVFETGATILIKEDSLTEYTFEEIEPGVYKSIQDFGVNEGKEYELSITTQNGMIYKSEKVIAPGPTSIENVYAKRTINDEGVEGIGIFLNSFDPLGNSMYYRYDFEETYQIITPLWIATDLIATVQGNEVIFDTASRPEEEQVCYKTQRSNRISLVNTSGLIEDRIEDQMVNFIPADDIRVENRYSILVKQYVQTLSSHSFYNTLNEFSSSENIFSQIQPGFITGNIKSVNNPDEKVVGFFDVSSLAEERIFFNRKDFLEGLPKFEYDCEEFIPERGRLESVNEFRIRIATLIRNNRLRVLRFTPIINPDGEPNIVFVPRLCGDCTILGKPEPPDFWIE
ncbi:hypothetical protein GCM10009430_39530 [Aquimarina litoralis]|uniref:DUF4249 domain-containing protein n=1 Tax=Aquimarina litoralis TaxID=584605 RepID=A0ABP3UDP4_9FLAO